MIDNLPPNAGLAAVYLVAAAAAGIVTDQLLYGFVRSRALANGSEKGLQLARGLHGLPSALGVIGGASLAVSTLELAGRPGRWATTSVRVIAILALTAFSAKILGGVVRAYTQHEDTPVPGGTIFVNLARVIVWVIGVVSLLAALGIEVAPLVTALGVGGLAVGLALQPTLENVFSGLQLLATRQIKPGDFIRLDSGQEGVVLDVNWSNTLVQQPSMDVVIVPNSVLSRAVVTNFSAGEQDFVLTVPVSFASAGDPDAVERIALEVARQVVRDVEGAVHDSEPGARFAELTPPAAVLNVTMLCSSYQDRVPVRHEFIRRLAKRFAEEGVESPPVAYPGRPRP